MFAQVKPMKGDFCYSENNPNQSNELKGIILEQEEEEEKSGPSIILMEVEAEDGDCSD